MRVLLAVLIILFVEPSQGWARRRRSDAKKRSLEARSVNSIVKDTCNTEVNACGFTIKCTCCKDPSFKSCAGTNLIGSPLLTVVKREAEEKRQAEERVEADEAGCHLRSVVYNGQELCIPGNVAAMISIVSTATNNECYPVYPMGCLNPLKDETRYYQHFYIGENAGETLDSLAAHGHKCHIQNDVEGANAGEIKCLI